MYLVEVPNVDPSKTWHTVTEFKTRSEAIGREANPLGLFVTIIYAAQMVGIRC
ncbi:MAG: hypothetical protein KME09_00975 [Pleurocapsa minor HA4230-MV1]|nr:hypothetical protein [Pleurocapsa minor HA4230-MV1]